MLPKPKNPLERLLGDLADGDKDETLSLGTAPATLRGADTLRTHVLPLVEGLDPQRTAALKTALLRLEMLQKEGVVLMMPELVIGD